MERTARNSWTNRTIRLSLDGTISLEFIPETLNCSYTGVRNSYDALARARPRIKGGISASRNLRDLSQGKFLTASCCHEFIGLCNFFVVRPSQECVHLI